MQQNSQHNHRAWAEINLDHLIYNFKQAQKLVAPRPVYCIIKADAYGHGAIPVARALAAEGATHFAVATPEEALQLRGHGITQSILLLGSVDASWAPQMAAQNVSMEVGSLAIAQSYAAALNGTPLQVHIKVDTGMSRLGLPWQNAVPEATEIASLKNLKIEGLFTHFAVADEPEQDDFTNLQWQRFQQVADALQQKGIHIPLRHAANSAGVLMHPQSHADIARPGVLLYGHNPCPTSPLSLKPVLSLKTRVAQVHTVAKGETVSYGRIWCAPKDSVIATVSMGYADGLFRSLSGKIDMLVKGKRAPQVGRICMDMCMLDITDIPGVQAGDTAILLGEDGDQRISAEDIAAAANTIPYEVFCAVGRRLPRLYYKQSQLVEQRCYIENL